MSQRHYSLTADSVRVHNKGADVIGYAFPERGTGRHVTDVNELSNGKCFLLHQTNGTIRKVVILGTPDRGFVKYMDWETGRHLSDFTSRVMGTGDWAGTQWLEAL